jgi:hypothetical protein
MINFFRKIRKQLADDNKPLKYMRYAIGEIVLVVIGILIALSINNWNEQNKENKIEHKYLERLMIDLGIDSSYYEQKIAVSELAIKQLNEFIHKSYKTQKSIEEVKQLFSLLNVSTDPLTTQNSTFNELSSTGNINIFKNESLKKLIIDYYWITEELTAQIEEFNLVSTEYLIEANRVVRSFNKFMPVFANIFDNSNMYLEGEWEYINDPRSEKFQALQSVASIYHLRNREHLIHFKRLKTLSSDLTIKLKETLRLEIIE